MDASISFTQLANIENQHNQTQAIRALYASASAPSMADTLPSIDWKFDDLRAQMNAFTVKFDDFIEKGRRRVLEERNGFLSGLEALRGSFTMVPCSVMYYMIV